MKCLVTGGAGFIGSHLVEALLNEGHQVSILDNFSHGNNMPSREVEVINGDITENLEKILGNRSFDYIFHLAAQIDLRYSLDNPSIDAKINLFGSINVISWSLAHKIKKFIFASSAAVYFSDNNILLKEESILKPSSPYGFAKLSVEEYLQLMKESKGFSYCALRFSNVYGPRQDSHGEAGVVSIFLDKISRGEYVSINGDGKQTRDFVYVKDVVSALMKAKELDGIYNVSTGKETMILNLIEEINAITGKRTVVKNLPAKKEVLRSSLDSSKLKSTGWKPEFSLQDGLKETYNTIKNGK